jgi:PAS domain S-box-containing protein
MKKSASILIRSRKGPGVVRKSARQSERAQLEGAFLLQQQLLSTRDYAEAIIEAVPPLLVLDEKLCVQTANKAFCKSFKISQRQTINRRVYELGNGQWNIPRLRTLLEEILPRKNFFEDFEVTHTFESIGRRTMLLSGRQVDHLQRILLFIEDITEQRAAHASMRNSEIRYRRLFEAARDGILILDPTTRKITDANPFMSELLDYPRAELLGKELWEIGLLKDEKASRAAFRELRKKHFIRYEDLPLQTKAGERHEVEFVSNLYQEDGKEVIQCNIRDITQRKLSEGALRASEESFRALFDLGPVAVYSCDAVGTIQKFNRRSVELWGREPKSGDVSNRFCGSLRLRHAGGTVMPHDQCPMAEVLSGKKSSALDVEVVIERPDGSRITVIVNIVPLRDVQGKITGAINSFYDITERKHAEDFLRESEERFHAIFTRATIGIAQTDLDGRFTLVNKCYCKIAGRKEKELLGLTISDITHKDDLATNLTLLKQLKEDGRSFVVEKRYVRPNGHIVWVRNSVSYVKHPPPDGPYFLALAEDITERRLAQQALLAAKNDIGLHALKLEEVITERTGKLRETIGELEGFSYSVSHDMRAPLRAMQSFAQFLVDDYSSKLDEQGINYLQQIMRSAVRLDRLIQDVLSYTRILHTHLPIEPVDLDRLVRDLIESFPNGQAIKPKILIEGSLPKVMGSEALLAQCVSNLLSNGIKFVSRGTAPHMKISAEAIDDTSVRIWFKDNGIGIAPVDRTRIFRLFERIHPSAEYEGTGIGLTIVRKAVERMGAKIGFESVLGKGTNFWIQLTKA